MQNLKINIFNQKIYKVSFSKQYCVIIYYCSPLCLGLGIEQYELFEAANAYLQKSRFMSKLGVRNATARDKHRARANIYMHIHPL